MSQRTIDVTLSQYGFLGETAVSPHPNRHDLGGKLDLVAEV
jgi:hypothetical protein